MTLRTTAVLVQGATFMVLGYALVRAGEYKLAAAQALLGAVTWLVYA